MLDVDDYCNTNIDFNRFTPVAFDGVYPFVFTDTFCFQLDKVCTVNNNLSFRVFKGLNKDTVSVPSNVGVSIDVHFYLNPKVDGGSNLKVV